MKRSKLKQGKREIPNSIKDQASWQCNRRAFVKTMFLAGLYVQVPLLQSCFTEHEEYTGILSKEYFKIVQNVQDILFPSDQLGPGALEFKADKYLIWVLSDKRLDPEEQQYIINGIGWVEETAMEDFTKRFHSLNSSEKEQLIATISKKSWGESWLSVMLTFIFEAMFADSVYASNPDGIGWKWLEHNPGLPRPTKELKYDNILLNLEL